MIDLCLVGTGGTWPLPERFLASLLVRYQGKLILIDCGEGTQVSLRKLGWGLRDLGTLLITHFHADHVAGLPGLLLTVGNSGRGADEPFTIVGPRGVGRIVEGLRVVAKHLPFPVEVVEWTGADSDKPVSVEALRVTAAPADHGCPCLAYRLDLPRQAEFHPRKAKDLGLPVQQWRVLQKGGTVEHEGVTYYPEQVLGDPRPGLSVGYVTDSRPTESLMRFVTGVDLLVCEGTYGDPDDRPKAVENKHMTFTEAGLMASAAGAGRLWLTHFSTAMPNPHYFRRHAEAAYPGAVIGHDHMAETLKFRD